MSTDGIDTNSPTLDTVIAERLPFLDEHLAESGVDLPDRPLRATFDFIRIWVVAIDLGNGEVINPAESPEAFRERWFGVIFRSVEAWYRHRYREAFEAGRSRNISGFVPIWSTAFELAIPDMIVDPDAPTGSVWLRFPDKVLPSENSLEWLRLAPSLDQLSQPELEQLISAVNDIATLLRSINASLLGIADRGSDLGGLLAAIRNHLRSAAARAVSGGHPTLETGCWDLHMAAECSLKAFLCVKTGSFPSSHDLDYLFGLTQGGLPTLHTSDLRRLPHWRKAVAYRYGDGPHLSLDAYWTLYQATLRIVESALEPLVEFRLGDARLNVTQPPWGKENP